jgi:hypothetical protein
MLRLYVRCRSGLLNPKVHYRGQNILPLDTAPEQDASCPLSPNLCV